MSAVSDRLPIIHNWDIFDVILRACILVYIRVHHSHYTVDTVFVPDPHNGGVDEVNRGSFEKLIKEILSVDWLALNIPYNEKLSAFFNVLNKLTDQLDTDTLIRRVGYSIVLVSFFRIVVYMRVHPRIAVLYKTVEIALDDLIHFFLVFFFLFFVSAQMSSWMFGSDRNAFGTLQNSLQTHFEMLVGVVTFPNYNDSDYTFFLFFLMFFYLIMFFFLLNFFLAIIVDSYGKVKNYIEECEIEESIFKDCCTLFIYPFYKFYYGWPDR